jgi:hypothetical protein
VSCCQVASDDEIETDPAVFDCDTCPVAQALGDLWPENAQAWDLFKRLATRFVVDAGLAASVFQRLTEDLDVDEMQELVERLTVIYDLVMPAPAEP